MTSTTHSAASALLDDLLARLDACSLDARGVVAALPETAFQLLTRPSLRLTGNELQLGGGNVISQGAAVGRAYQSMEHLLAAPADEPKILVCERLQNTHICKLAAMNGVLARYEDPSSHWAIVSRANGTPVLAGVDAPLADGEWISIDAFGGRAYRGRAELVAPKLMGPVTRLMELLVATSRLRVHANADSEREVRLGAELWAAGYEPRTEHMVLQDGMLRALQTALLSAPEQRSRHLAKLSAIMRCEVGRIYALAGARPVLVRLLDPPIHEFLPCDEHERLAVAVALEIDSPELARRIAAAQEVNPMLGTRGARLLLVRPDLVQIQVEAVLHAALDHGATTNAAVVAHITIPMVVDVREVTALRAEIDSARERVSSMRGRRPAYRLGIMVETPRAALTAGHMARHVDYLSFGTNDLTALVFAFSRGDVYEKFLGHYLDAGILASDPFLVLDESVLELMALCVRRARAENPNLAIGVCGEHASQPEMIAFCLSQGIDIDSVSVSPTLIPQTLFHAARLSLVATESGSTPGSSRGTEA